MTTAAVPATRATSVDRLLEAATRGTGVPTDVFADDVVLDATVPNWRFTVTGPAAVAAQYSSWFADPASFEEIERMPIEGGEVVTYFLAWVERGVPHAAHHCHVLRLDEEGLVKSDRFFCGGRWPADLLAEMAGAS